LQQIAKITGGQYFRAYTTSDLQEIYTLLDQLEPVEKDVKSYRPIKALFYVPLAAGLAFAAVLALLLYAPQFSIRSLFSEPKDAHGKAHE
jgi:Ca-activated chloride channel family protein